jgi:hypothetical protein
MKFIGQLQAPTTLSQDRTHALIQREAVHVYLCGLKAWELSLCLVLLAGPCVVLEFRVWVVLTHTGDRG